MESMVVAEQCSCARRESSKWAGKISMVSPRTRNEPRTKLMSCALVLLGDEIGDATGVGRCRSPTASGWKVMAV